MEIGLDIWGRTASGRAAGKSGDRGIQRETLHGVRKRNRSTRFSDAASARGERGVEAAREHVILRQKLVVKDSETRAHRSFPVLERIPSNTNSRRKIFQCWVGVPGIANDYAGVRNTAEIGDFPVCFRGNGSELVSQAQIEGQIRFQAIVVLQERCKERLPESAIRIDSSRHSKVYLRRCALQEILQSWERLNAPQLARGLLIELHALALKSKPQTVRSPGPKARVMPPVIVQVVVPRETVITPHRGHQCRNGQKSELHPARRGRYPP